MATLLADPALRRRMGAAARDWAVRRLPLDEHVRRMGELLEQLARGGMVQAGAGHPLQPSLWNAALHPPR